MPCRPEALMLLLAVAALPVAAGEPGAARAAELGNLLRHDCGACHGLTLHGGLGPPLVPETVRGKPAAMLVDTILEGRPGTAMPPWRPFLSRTEAEWLVERLQEGTAP